MADISPGTNSKSVAGILTLHSTPILKIVSKNIEKCKSLRLFGKSIFSPMYWGGGGGHPSDRPGPRPRPKFKPPATVEICPKLAGVLQNFLS